MESNVKYFSLTDDGQTRNAGSRVWEMWIYFWIIQVAAWCKPVAQT